MNEELAAILHNNGIAVIATDTIYGIVGKASEEAVVQRLYEIKGRDEVKPFIVLIPAIESLGNFGIAIDEASSSVLAKIWPGAVTVILPVAESNQARLQYLHRGTNEIAFRMPAKQSLLQLLEATGPLVAPSANPQGLAPATTTEEAKEYFGDSVDFYTDEGAVVGEPSTIIRIVKGEIEVLRQGSVSL